MNFIIKPRGTDKTTDLLNLAHHNKGVILTIDGSHKKFLEVRAEDLGFNDIKIISVSDLTSNKTRFGFTEKTDLYIDEADAVLDWLIKTFNHNLNCKLGTLTLKEVL